MHIKPSELAMIALSTSALLVDESSASPVLRRHRFLSIRMSRVESTHHF